MSSCSSPVNSHGIPRLDLNNQTGDSREDDSTQNDVSSPSLHRGFSSDDHSGWKSETTDTSEGNFSLSQYPLDDPSCGEESPQETSSLHEEALTSAITEVSKDFISGNFSPGKFPHVESDSSDGDHLGDGHTGAVYARYPDSAGGMSDCDWNPYGTDNETPRSSASDHEYQRSRPISTTSTIRHKENEIRIPTGSDNGNFVTRDFVRLPIEHGNNQHKTDTVHENEFAPLPVDTEKETFSKGKDSKNQDFISNQHPVVKSKSDGDQKRLTEGKAVSGSKRSGADLERDSYAMYSPDKEVELEKGTVRQSDQSSTASTLQGSGDRVSQWTANQYIPGGLRELYGSSSYDRLSGGKAQENVNSGTSSTSNVPQSSHSKSTSGTVVSSEPNGEGLKQKNSYVTIGDRAKLLGLPEDFLNQPEPSASGSTDFAVPRVGDLPLLSRVQIPEKEHASNGTSGRESMSQRVSKLLEEASQLGTTLHHQLYSREALGLESGREPSILRSHSPTKKSDGGVDKSAERSVTPGSGYVTKSGEHSVRSSLGEEVAKLLAKSDEDAVRNSIKSQMEPTNIPMKVGSIPSSNEMTIVSSQTYPSLAVSSAAINQSVPSLVTTSTTQSYSSLSMKGLQAYPPNAEDWPQSLPAAGIDHTAEPQTYLSLPNTVTGKGPGSTDSQESADSLSQRVKKILADTAYVEKMKNGSMNIGSFDYSRLQKDLQEIQSHLDPGIDYNLRMSIPSPDFSKASDKSTESSKAHKLLWDHGADLGYDDSLSGRFLGTMKTDTETECESTCSGKGYNGLSDTLEMVGKKECGDVVSDQVESDFDEGSLGKVVAPDVEEIIRRYQTEKPVDAMGDSGDSSGLASRVKKILSKEPPKKQALDILKTAKQEEKELRQIMNEKPKLDASYDSQGSESSFFIQDKDVRKQLEWSEISGIEKSINSSYLSTGLKSQPFSALGNAKTFLSSQLAKNVDRTFNHSIDLKTPYRHVLDCYPVYGVEKTRGAAEVDQFGRTEPDGVKDAWTDDASSQDGAAALLLGATNQNTANVRPGSRDHQRTYSDPRELSPDGRNERPIKPLRVSVGIGDEDGHTRSKSEEPRYGDGLPRDRFYNLEPVVSVTDRRAASSPHGDETDKEKHADVRRKDLPTGTPPSESSPSSAGQLSPPDSDNSSRRRESARLRPYRPHGSRELYYTEDGEDSLAESITTVESNHTGSDDAVGPSFPPHYLGSRKDGPSTAGGIYSNRTQEKRDTLSTIDEKSMADERERSGTDSGVDNPRSDLASSHGSLSYKRDTARERTDEASGRLPSQLEDRLGLSTRSDPGDQYATPKRSSRHHDNSDPRSDSRVYRDSYGLDQREPAPVKSRSETDLATLPDNDRKYSSPINGARFMEISTQPSPIYSHHNSMASPTFKGKYADDRLKEERLNVKPLEKGPDYSPRNREDHLSTGSLSLREEGDGINKDDKPGSTPYNKGYGRQPGDSLPQKTRYENSDVDPRGQVPAGRDAGHLINTGNPSWESLREPDYRSRGSSLELGSKDAPRPSEAGLGLREQSRPLEKGSGTRDVVRPLDKGADLRSRGSSQDSGPREIVRPLDRGPDYLEDGQKPDLNVRSSERGPGVIDPELHVDTINPGYRPTDRVIDYVRDDRLNHPEEHRDRPLDRGPNYYDMYKPRREPQRQSSSPPHRMYDDDGEELEFKELPRCPDPDFEDLVNEERVKVMKESESQRRLKQKGYLQNSIDEKDFGAEYDRVPPNARAKSLQHKLEQESHRELPPNINDLWLKFQEMNHNESTSTINSSRMEAITDLLKNPTKHIVQRMADERTYEKVKERRILQDLTEKAREGQRKDTLSERKRQELQNLRRLSEEESNGSYAEILEEQRRKKQAQMKHKKENVKPEAKVDIKQVKENENKMKGSKKQKMDTPVPVDSIDTLYSIAEDASFEVTPSKVGDSPSKAKKSRQRHVIDPLMNKLKDKIESQRKKIDKERRKEIKRMDKLKKLEMLLNAKKKGKLSDQAIDVELQYVSTTSVAASSESSTLFGSETTMSADSVDHNKYSGNSTAVTGDSTSVKDSSIEIQKIRTKKVKPGGMLDAYMASIGQNVKLDESEASTDDLQVVRKIRSPKPSKSAAEKKRSKEKQNLRKADEDGKETRTRDRSKSPKSRKVKDASVNVPSPIIKSPVSRRKARDVYVRSEAVQTSPCRSWSPPREEQGVISMTIPSPSKREVKPFDSRKQRQLSYSPGDSYSSVSPNRSITSRSISPPNPRRSAGVGKRSTRSKSPPKPRVFLPESDSDGETRQLKASPLPKSRMFTPETPDDDLAGKIKDSPNEKRKKSKRSGYGRGGLTWFVPMKESKPWRKPLKERQAFTVRQEPWQPTTVSSTAWKDIVTDNPLNKSLGECSQFDLDTTGHVKDLEDERSDEENFDPKPLSRLTLQEAFQTYKQEAISKLRARQKRLALASKERHLQEMLEKERNRLFAEEKRKKEANPEAHPLSENLHKPKRRAISKGEMKELTQKLYKKLPEVQNQKEEAKRKEDYSLNRLRAKVFNRRIQKNCLKKHENRTSKRSPAKSIH